ncbi:MAG: hypothetical protein JWR44_3764 [Hymenobacter sp.]|jgi:hypothetical protein|nr:hypothetical protein [Hymenobacter sp.]
MQLRLFLLCAALATHSFHALGQVYEPGLLVRSNGDTLRGEIENGFWVEPPAFIHYRPTADAPGQLYQPRQLRAVRFTGGRYFRFEALPIDHAAETRQSYLPHGNKSDIRIDSLLAEVLIEGSVTMFRVAWPSTTHYLLRGPDRPVLDLCRRQYLRQTRTSIGEVADGNNYKGLLGGYFAACPSAFSAAQTAPFTAEGLAAVVQVYNQTCSLDLQPGRSWLAQAKPRRRMSFRGGVLAGVRYNRIENDGLNNTTDCTDCRPHPFAGLYAELFQPSRTSAIYGELSLSRFHTRNTQPSFYQYPLTSFDYDAWLGTARLGARFFTPLPQEQQLLFTFTYELNAIRSPTVTAANGPLEPINRDDLHYASPTIIPNIGVGWRSRKLTLNLDGQLYHDSNTEHVFSSIYFGHNFALRASIGFRLGKNPDVPANPPATGR